MARKKGYTRGTNQRRHRQEPPVTPPKYPPTNAPSAPPEKLLQLVELSEQVRPIINAEGMAAVEKIMENHDLVWAVWQDMDAPNGVGSMLVKGIALLREIVARGESGERQKVSIAAIPCIEMEQAYALRLMHGDGTDLRSLQ